MDLRRILTPDYWLSFIKFDVVGIIGVFVNEGLFLLLLFEGTYYLYADALAIEVSILSNFLLNEFWTFRERRHGHVALRLVKFNGLMLVGLAVNLAILYGLTTYFGIVSGISNLVGIGAAFLLRYWLSVRFVWMKKEEESVVPVLAAEAPA
ncbi:MAG: GtrA family protein [Nitrososphaerota archaeon]|nr:GtrA family protein [Nitrososphaerota archaeon]MDG6975189.1 GtrA family protein [Nitrososphaerota archaeon]MDG7010077.1 GtrA family protein [Nitrososphaerota archaeon]MDG7016158.1 GtrA family protein [Nitrososphaerota archaeon]MDG7019485.1 GtrA family protein [Nitrososphaerota archaeon]